MARSAPRLGTGSRICRSGSPAGGRLCHRHEIARREPEASGRAVFVNRYLCFANT
jgi:hypothetical protein